MAPQSNIQTPKLSVPFWKLQAIGNDFPLFHMSDLEGIDLSELAKSAADRKFGIGGDGILVMQSLAKDKVELRMFNPDGTEDFCGNGLRIAARHAFDQGWVGEKFTLVHGGREIPSEVRPSGQILTTIGVADYTPAKVPVLREKELFQDLIAEIDGRAWRGSSLTTGSTHTVIEVSQLPDDREISELGPELEYLPIFPDRTSVIFVREVGPNELQIRIWERGVGETLGCGTGSSAAAADYLRKRGTGGEVVVHNPGGDIVVSMEAWDKPITIQGEAFAVYEGAFGIARLVDC